MSERQPHLPLHSLPSSLTHAAGRGTGKISQRILPHSLGRHTSFFICAPIISLRAIQVSVLHTTISLDITYTINSIVILFLPLPSFSFRITNPLRSSAPGGGGGGGGGGEIHSVASDAARHFEVGMNEATYSLAWLPSQPLCLLAGMGSKFLRLYDVRGTSHSHYPFISHGNGELIYDSL